MMNMARSFKQAKHSSKDLYKSFEGFMRYLEYLEKKDKKSNELVQKAKFTLGLPVKETSGFSQDGFGPLLRTDGTLVTTYGLDIPGREFIARLWFFVSTYFNPGPMNREDMDKTQYAVVTSLAEAVDQDKKRVCDDEKIQLLFANVIQGRIKMQHKDA